MRPNAELRLFALPACAGLVYAVTKGLIKGWNGTQLFSGFLFGSVIAMVLGIPLLLWMDRRWPQARTRYLWLGLILSLVATLLVRTSWTQLLLLPLAGGLLLGGLYSLLIRGIEQLSVPLHGRAWQGWRVLAVPLSGALTLGGVAVTLYPKGEQSLAVFSLGALIGAWLSMLVSWPMLWLVDRFLATGWRHVIGGGLSGLLIWLLSGAPGLFAGSLKGASGLDYWVPLFNRGIFPFLLLGLLAGVLFSLLNGIGPRRPVAAGE
ncbi:hypothetical protein [Pseudomonas sp. St29]|uniref:hypothetical protein n=1 Tax=Pseudomonas sp. St29 TaxID=1500687 RepID=UPI0005FC9007|nr:hypothetical protein [Pseudomonas sp. St29]BAQ80378.1 putative membrane protein [Pseudomonas sp. St29]